jgi:hypothetical protein
MTIQTAAHHHHLRSALESIAATEQGYASDVHLKFLAGVALDRARSLNGRPSDAAASLAWQELRRIKSANFNDIAAHAADVLVKMDALDIDAGVVRVKEYEETLAALWQEVRDYADSHIAGAVQNHTLEAICQRLCTERLLNGSTYGDIESTVRAEGLCLAAEAVAA